MTAAAGRDARGRDDLMDNLVGPGGKVVETTKWPWVAPQFPVPMEEELKVPVKAGETRDYVYTTAPPEAGEGPGADGAAPRRGRRGQGESGQPTR